MKSLVVLGSTGSIGRQTLEVVSLQKRLKLVGISFGYNVRLAERQISSLNPRYVASLKRKDSLRRRFPDSEFFWGAEGIEEMLRTAAPDYVMVAVPGIAGLRYSLVATEIVSRICLANKEALVCGGPILLESIKRNGVELLPVDSEHSAVFQLLEQWNRPCKIFITASGGAVRDLDAEALQHVRPAQVLRHPVWSMGKKVTIDSATMVNKGLEVIEACYLFGMPQERILTLICRNSIIHGGVIYDDGVVKLHAGWPDMKIPISYALNYPVRQAVDKELDMTSISLSLEPLDERKYPALALAREISGQPSFQIAYNSADEVAVEAFLSGKIRFTDVFRVIRSTVNRVDPHDPSGYNEVMEIDRVSRILAKEEVSKCSSQ